MSAASQPRAALGRFDAAAEKLAAAFWPGPLTLVLPKRPDCGVADLALAGLDSVAVRVPAHPVARALLAAFKGPVVAPSANRSGHVSPTSAAHVLADLRGRIDMVIDAGPCAVGVESTIVACLGEPTLLRPGGLPREQIERVLGTAAGDRDNRRRRAARARHAVLALCAEGAAAARRRGSRRRRSAARFRAGARGGVALNLSPRGDLIEAAANLFSHLRALDASGAKAIAVMKVPHEGLGEAINDRLSARRRAQSRGTADESAEPSRSPSARWRPNCWRASSPSSAQKYAITDASAQEPYLVEMRDLLSRPDAGGAAAGLGRGGGGDPQARQRNQDRDRAARRQYRPGRRANSVSRRDRAVAHPARQDPRGRSGLQHHDVEAGVTLQRAREAAAAADRLYPQLLPSEGTCTIGGNLSTNAGGTAAIAHGIARSHALGLEVVLADGRVLHDLNKLKKDNTGYDLQEPVHRRGRHARHHHRGGAAAGAAPALGRDRLCRRALAAGRGRSARHCHRAHRRRRHLVRADGARRRRSRGQARAASRIRSATPYPWYVLIELSSQARSGLREVMEEILGEGHEKGLVLDATIADSLEQGKAFWRIREMFGEVQRQSAPRSSTTCRCRWRRSRRSSRRPTPR